MVVKIQKVILKFIGTGIYDEYQAYINIYDSNGNIVFQDKTYNGEVVLYLCEDTCYGLLAMSCGEIIKTSFYVSDQIDKYVFVFSRSIYNRTITFLLTDANYNNLPIEKGEMVLWQK